MTNKYWLSPEEWEKVRDIIEKDRKERAAQMKASNEKVQKCFDAFVKAVYDYYDQYGTTPDIQPYEH